MFVLAVATAVPAFAAAGDLDATFGGDGRVTTRFRGGAEANAVAIQADGMIVAAGGSNGRFALARYNSRGHLDETFGGDGRVRTSFAGGAEARAVAIQPDGRIVAVGDAADRFAIARYRPNGRLDRRFGGDGRVTTRFWDSSYAHAVAIQPDGRIVIAGQTNRPMRSAAAIARYRPNGSLDPSFGADGKVTVGFTAGSGTAYGVAIQPDGKIVVVGEDNAGGGFSLAGLLPNGEVDTGFGEDGTFTTRRLGGGARAVALRPDGRIVVAGSAGDIFGPFAVARFTRAGRPDRTFGSDGFVTVDMGGGEESAQALVLQPDGKIVVAGYTNVPHEFGDTGNGAFALGRFHPKGRLDKTFGQSGKVLTEFDAGLALGMGLALQPNGKIVAAGWAGGRFGLARYLES